MKHMQKLLLAVTVLVLMFGITACTRKGTKSSENSQTVTPTPTAAQTPTVTDTVTPTPTEEPTPAPEKNGDIVILYTSDVHCGVDQGFGYAGLAEIRDSLISEGDLIMHHSDAFTDAYHPHYRIVSSDIFEKELHKSLQ